MEALLVFIIGIIFGAFSATVASNKGYNQASWAAAGFFFGPIGFLATLGLPDRKQRKYLRLLLEHYGVSVDSTVELQSVELQPGDSVDADAQRRRILGSK